MADRARVLVVDDRAEIRALLRAVLETNHDCDVAEASDGLEGMERLATERYDLLLTDIVMPVMTGLELLGYVRADTRHAGMRRVVVSAHNAPRDLERARELGAEATLGKPIDPAKFTETIAPFLRPRSE